MGVPPFDLIIKVIPEVLGLSKFGFGTPLNQPGWYISTLLISLLPLCYLLNKNKDFFIYVFSPLASFGILGYFCIKNSPDQYNVLSPAFENDILGCFTRAVCGICFGAVAWIIYKKICTISDTPKNKMLLTISEVIMNLLFFYTWLIRESTYETLYCVMILLPIMIAVAFSQKSYISELFKFRWMRHCGSLSLIVYLNHYVPTLVVIALLSDKPYMVCLGVVLVLTIICSVASFIGIKILKFIGRKLFSTLKDETNV